MNLEELHHRLELYHHAKKLHEKGLGYKKIKQYLKDVYNSDVPISTIRNWVLDIASPSNRYRIPSRSPELAYVIGGWLGDGLLSSYRRNYEYIIRLVVKDYDFAKTWGLAFSKAVKSKYKYKPIWSHKLNRWCVSVRNFYLYKTLKVARENPFVIFEYIRDFPYDFLRGFLMQKVV